MRAFTPHKPRAIWRDYLFGFVVTAVLIAPIALMLRPHVHAEEVTVTNQKLLAAASTINTRATITPAFMPRCRESAIYINWGAGVSGGAITIESSFDQNYAGTWAPLAAVVQSGASRLDIVQITGVHLALATRVSTGLTGGTVDTWLVCN